MMKRDSCRFYCYWNTRKPNSAKADNVEKIKLVIFDMDGVLTDIISSWKHIHDYFGCSNQKSVKSWRKSHNQRLYASYFFQRMDSSDSSSLFSR